MNKLLPAVVLLGLGTTLAIAMPPSTRQTTAPDHVALAPSDVKWMAAPAVLPKGVQIAVLHGNPFAEGFSTVRLKIPPHMLFAPHWHPSTESFSVLKGNLFLGMGDHVDKAHAIALPARGFASMPAMHHHYVYTTDQETVIDLSFYGPFQMHYVNPADDPRNK